MALLSAGTGIPLGSADFGGLFGHRRWHRRRMNRTALQHRQHIRLQAGSWNLDGATIFEPLAWPFDLVHELF